MFGKRQRIHEQIGGSSPPKTDGGTAAGLSGRTCRKMVLCLDTNYLSNLAKARSDLYLSEEDASLWRELLSVLENAVWSDLLICPGFDVQIEEAEFDDRLALPVWTMMRALSLGVQFLPHDSIIARQVEDAGYRFLSQEPPAHLPWDRILQGDPDASAVELSRRARSRPFVPPFHSPEEVARRRAAKTESLLAERHGGGLGAEQRALVARWFSRDALRDLIDSVRADCPPQDMARWRSTLEQVDTVGVLRQAGMTAGRMVEFVGSDELKNIRYVDIYCSIVVAAHQASGDERTLRGGDEFDRRIVSAVMPSCDLLCTDRFVKHVLVDQLHYDVKYQCGVFSGRVEDVRALVGKVRSLSSISSSESIQ